MNTPNSPCPDSAELAAFAFGDLNESRLEHLAEHIDQCESCGIVVDGMSKRNDSDLVAELRAMKIQSADLTTKSERLRNQVPEQLVKAACDAVHSSSSPASFDSGKRLANRLKNGPVRLGRFELKSELGVGSFGYVFKALDTELNRLVALKVQRAGTFATDEDAERFNREALSIAQLEGFLDGGGRWSRNWRCRVGSWHASRNRSGCQIPSSKTASTGNRRCN